jgi:hypothetical protein
MVEGNKSKFEVRSVNFNPEENSLLNTCVLLRSKNIITTPDPSLRLTLLKDQQRFSLEELVDSSYHPSQTINIT